eukprot:COSAG01_NODE_3259_length_6338_cov_3.955281_4_plen_105_part_00
MHLRSRLLPAPPPLARPSMRIHVTIRTEAGTDGRTGAAQPPLSPQQLTNCLCMCMCALGVGGRHAAVWDPWFGSSAGLAGPGDLGARRGRWCATHINEFMLTTY